MAKQRDIPGAGMLDMRRTKNVRPGMNPASSEVAVSSQPPSTPNISLNTIPEHSRHALFTYPPEDRAAMLPLDPRIPLEPYKPWDPEDEALLIAQPPTVTQPLRTSPRKRKEKELYEPEPFQKERTSPKTKRNKKSKEREHTPSEDEELPLWKDHKAMEAYSAKSRISRSQPLDDSQTPAPPQTPKKRRPDRQPGNRPVLGSRLTEEDDILMVGLALRYQARYRVVSMNDFWRKVREKFELLTKRTYASVKRHVKELLDTRRSQLKREAKAGHGHEAREDEWTKTMDDWDLVVKAQDEKKDIHKKAKEKKLKDTKRHDRARESLNERMGNKKKKTVTIDMSSEDTDENNSQMDDENDTNGASSTDDISDDLSLTPPPLEPVEQVYSPELESPPGTPTPGPSNSRVQTLLEGLSSDSEIPIPPSQSAKKKRKTPHKQRRQRRTKATANTEGIIELRATMTQFLKRVLEQPTAVTNQPTIAISEAQNNAAELKELREEVKAVTESVTKLVEHMDQFNTNQGYFYDLMKPFRKNNIADKLQNVLNQQYTTQRNQFLQFSALEQEAIMTRQELRSISSTIRSRSYIRNDLKASYMEHINPTESPPRDIGMARLEVALNGTLQDKYEKEIATKNKQIDASKTNEDDEESIQEASSKAQKSKKSNSQKQPPSEKRVTRSKATS